MQYYLDSCIWIDIIKQTIRKDKLTELLSAKIYTSDIVLLEVADFLTRNNKEAQTILQFIRAKSQLIALTDNMLIQASLTKIKQRRKNRKFGIADATHYACANSENCILITSDYDYTGLENVEIIKK
jgi:predicted nucleic acid-binding protein